MAGGGFPGRLAYMRRRFKYKIKTFATAKSPASTRPGALLEGCKVFQLA